MLPRNPDAPDDLYELVENVAGEDFAGGFLSRATIIGKDITPHTLTRWEMVRGRTRLMIALDDAGYKLRKPLPFGHRDRPNGEAERDKIARKGWG